MKSTPRSQLVLFPEEPLWNRGASSLSPRKRWLPRLIHATWHQKGTRVERRVEHTHNVYHICKVEEGKGSMLLHGQVVPVSPGSLILVSPGEPHAFEVNLDEHESYSEATFEVIDEEKQAVCVPLHALLSEWTGLPCSPWPAGAVIAPSVQSGINESIARIVRAALALPPRRAFLANRALLDLLEIVANDLSGIPSEESDPLQKAANLIESNLQGSLSVQALARQMGISQNHFIRTFRQRFGMTPLAYHQQIKINTAQRLLSQTQYSIKRIAEWTGFADVYYFSRLFTLKTGTPPGTYRIKNRSQGRKADAINTKLPV